MDEIKIPAGCLVSYLGAYMNAYRASVFRVGASHLFNRHPNENLVSKFERFTRGIQQILHQYHSTYLAEFVEGWLLWFRPDTRHHIVRRIGRVWWGGDTAFWLDLYKNPCLYIEVKPLIYQDFEAFVRNKESWSKFDYLLRGLRLLANYLNDNYYCQISVDTLEDKRIAFQIHYHLVKSTNIDAAKRCKVDSNR